jgi:phosphate transport system protein
MTLIATAEHTTRAFDADLQSLNRMISKMGGHAERQLALAVNALKTRDLECASSVVVNDLAIDFQQQEIGQRVVATIATRQPMAIDLREIIAVLQISNELERIGDLAKNIGKRVVALKTDNIPLQPLRGITQLGILATKLLKDVLDSYAERDCAKAIKVWNNDGQIDLLYGSLHQELLTCIMEDPGVVVPGVHLLFCAKNIERVGDHATNIAELIYYIVEGQALTRERPKVDSVDFAAFRTSVPSIISND